MFQRLFKIFMHNAAIFKTCVQSVFFKSYHKTKPFQITATEAKKANTMFVIMKNYHYSPYTICIIHSLRYVIHAICFALNLFAYFVVYETYGSQFCYLLLCKCLRIIRSSIRPVANIKTRMIHYYDSISSCL